MNRNVGLDAAKGVAMVVVVFAHVLLLIHNPARVPVIVLSGLVGVSVGVFMGVAAYLAALSASRSYTDTVRARFRQVGTLYVIWSSLYVLLSWVIGGPLWESIRSTEVWRVVLLGKGFSHLYYIPAFLQMVLVMPLVLWVARDRRLVRLALLAGLLGLATGPFFGDTMKGQEILARHWIVVHGPHVIAGAGLALGTISIRRPVVWILVGAVVTEIEAMIGWFNGVPAVAAFAKAGSLPMVLGTIALFVHRDVPVTSPLVRLGRRSLGVYLLHMAPIAIFAWLAGITSLQWWAVPILATGALVGSYWLVARVESTPLHVLFDGRFTLPRLSPATRRASRL